MSNWKLNNSQLIVGVEGGEGGDERRNGTAKEMKMEGIHRWDNGRIAWVATIRYQWARIFPGKSLPSGRAATPKERKLCLRHLDDKKEAACAWERPSLIIEAFDQDTCIED